jgi:hypothetical protein
MFPAVARNGASAILRRCRARYGGTRPVVRTHRSRDWQAAAFSLDWLVENLARRTRQPPSVLEASMHDWRCVTPDAPHGPSSNEPKGLRRSGLLGWLVVCAAGSVPSCQQAGVLDPQGPIASAELLLLLNSTAIMLVVVVPVILATLGFAWWYRSSNARASRGPDEALEGRIEFVVWSIPALVAILGRGDLDRRAINSIRGRRFQRMPSRYGSTLWRSIGNGCSSTPIRVSPRSITWSSRLEHRSGSGSPRRRS